VTARVVHDMPEAEYHAHPALSHSRAKVLRQTCPAKFRAAVSEEKRAFDVGRAAHALVLGRGAPLIDTGRDEWNTKEVKARVAEIREEGATPLRSKDYRTVHLMAEALAGNPDVAPMLDLDTGDSETSMFWTEFVPTTFADGTPVDIDIERRARLDYKREDGGVVRVIDYKTTTNAHEEAISATVAKYGYDTQADWYTAAAFACLPDVAEVGFGFIFQEKDPPYLCHAVYLDDPYLDDGAVLNRAAIELYARCVARNEWPGYGTPGRWTRISRPGWRDITREIEHMTEETEP
jgi:hypothetical protein